RKYRALRASPKKGTKMSAGRVILTCLALAVVAATPPTVAAQEQPPVKPALRFDALGDPLPERALMRIGTVRRQQQGPITFLAFGAGGKSLLSLGTDESLRTWDADTGKPLHDDALVQGVVRAWLSPDG